MSSELHRSSRKARDSWLTGKISCAALVAFFVLLVRAAWTRGQLSELGLADVEQHSAEHHQLVPVLREEPSTASTTTRQPTSSPISTSSGEDPPQVTMPAAVRPQPVSLIYTSTCEAMPGCSAIVDAEGCRLVGKGLADLPLRAGNGHFQVGASQAKLVPKGCVYNQAGSRLKWNADESSNAGCGKLWGCVCNGALPGPSRARQTELC
jgi:hypothetical protein